MREDEARTKWCPMARITIFPHVDDRISLAANRDISLLVRPNSFDPETDITKCIASDCMEWREQWKRIEVQSNGYCGLGGKP